MSVSHRDDENPSGGVSSNKVNLVNPVDASDSIIVQLSSMFFTSITSKDVFVVLVMSANVSGMRHDSLLGTYSLNMGST